MFSRYISFEPLMIIIKDNLFFLVHLISTDVSPVGKSKSKNHINEVCVFYLSIISDRVNNRFEELLTVKIGLIENPSFWHTVVAWHWITANFGGHTFWREGDKYFDIFLRAFLFDRLLQLSLVCTGISDHQDHTIVRHVVQGDLNACGNGIYSRFIF